MDILFAFLGKIFLIIGALLAISGDDPVIPPAVEQKTPPPKQMPVPIPWDGPAVIVPPRTPPSKS